MRGQQYSRDRPGSLFAFLKALPPALPYKGRFLLALLRNRFRTRTVLFYPQTPTRRHVVWKLCHVLGYRITSDLNAKFDYAFHFRDHTTKLPDARLQAIATQQRVINIGCTDISKSRVEAAFSKVFGYGSFVDPRNHSGPCVKKTEANGQHNYEVIDCPIEPEPGYIYQRVIQPEQRDGCYVEYRIPVFGGVVPMAVIKLRSIDDRFAAAAVGAIAIEKSAAISPDEEQKLLAACRDMGLDYGELDVMRDRADGRLYLIDMNDTPSGVYVRWGRAAYNTILERFSAALKQMLEQTRVPDESNLQLPTSNL